MFESSEYDIVIVGGGMVGATFACMLQQAMTARDTRILLLESAAIDSGQASQASFDSRCVALSWDSVNGLKKLGLWRQLEGRVQPIEHIHVSDQGRFGSVRLSSREEGIDALGYVIENQVLGRVINQSLAELDKVETVSPARVTALKPTRDGFKLGISGESLEGRQEEHGIQARLVVLAEGGRSGLSRSLGIHHHRHDYGQTAVVSTVAFTGSHDNIAYERFTRNGPMALLPLPPHEGLSRAGLIWTQPAGAMDEIMSLDDTMFLEKLQEEFGSRPGKFIRVGERKAFPVGLELAEEQTRPGLVLLGNVAQTLHPVAGQGFNLAFRNSLRLAGTLAKAVAEGENPGSASVLRGYVDKSQGDQVKTVFFSHQLNRVFSSDKAGLVMLRKAGLLGIDLLPPLKKRFTRQAMGLANPMVQLDQG